MTLKRVVVVGGSLAGVRAAQGLRRHGFDGELTVVSAESGAPYDRPPLSKAFLAGEVNRDAITLTSREALDVTWLEGTRATGVDLRSRRVGLDGVGDIYWDGLVIATGLRNRSPTWAGTAPNMHMLRTVDDADRLRRSLTGAPRVAVVGAGFIGCEVASTARSLGCEVTILEAAPTPMFRALGGDVGSVIARLHRREGSRLETGVTVVKSLGDERIESLELSDGRTVDTDLVIAGLGADPAVEWLRGSGIDYDTKGGVRTDAALRCSVEGVVAAGDVVSWLNPSDGHRRQRVEHWTCGSAQGQAVARALLEGANARPFAHVPTFWSDQCRIRIHAVGWPHRADAPPRFSNSQDMQLGTTVAEYRRHGQIIGAVAFGSVAALTPYHQAIRGAPPAQITLVDC